MAHDPRTVVLAFQTIMRDYLDAETRAAYERGMRDWLAAAPAASALWVELEIDHGEGGTRAPIVAHARDPSGLVEFRLGVTGYHPATVEVEAASVARLAQLFR